MATKKTKEIKIFGLASEEAVMHFKPLLPEDFELKTGGYVMGAVNDDLAPIGVCWFSFDGYEYEILFIGVHPDYRRQGIGTKLLQRTLSSLYEMDMVMPVNASYIRTDFTAAFTEFLRAQGNFFFLGNDLCYRITKEDRKASKLYQKILSMKSDAKPFFDQPENVRRAFVEEQEALGFYYLTDLMEHENDYEKNLCFCYIDNLRIVSVLLVKKESKDLYELSYVYVDEDTPVFVQKVLSAAMSEFEKCAPKAELLVNAVTENSIKLVKDIFGGCNLRSDIIEAATWDYSLREDI
ncbi:MAG: GNAT family N-acetyltransferase [Lachnospiraceae bacterium]|nr:GNAT family N-acetyltransferase [Lachnospiraceae bacterium]